jgi:hypothetical protein
VPTSPAVYDVHTFGVEQGPEPFRALKSQFVSLPRILSRARLDYGQLWKEPAITVLDWLFTPIPRLEEHLYVEPLRPSTQFYSRFSLPWNSSNSFGSQTCDFGHFHTPPLITCGLVAFASDAPLQLILATNLHSVARYSKRTMQRHFSAASHYHCSVSESFQSLLRVLFSVPSRYYALSDSLRV